MPRTNFSYNQPETRDTRHETIALLSALSLQIFATGNPRLETRDPRPETRDAGHETIALLSALSPQIFALNLKLQTLNVFPYALCSLPYSIIQSFYHLSI